ncbi:MAG: glycolate oxidase subunit GlcE [Burkholderiaceae bacterium]|nr:glycolate oxidase subunit GlcE [Burkholderiaceae bacterium]
MTTHDNDTPPAPADAAPLLQHGRPPHPALAPLVERIRAAAADGTPLRLRGGGTKDFLGARLAGEVQGTRALTGIVSYEPSELVVTVHAGTPLAELEAALAAQGQQLACEPPHFGAGATVGGMVAAGLAGPARASRGGVRDFMLGVTVVNGRGEVLSFGGQVMKNVAGYDVSRLMAGSWGTLALIAEVSLKVLPVPPARATLRFDGVAEAAAIALLNRWGGQPLPLDASAWQPDAASTGGGTLWLRLAGARAAVASALHSLRQAHGGHTVDDGEAAALWHALREQAEPFFTPAPGQALWRLSVPDTTPPLGLGPTLVEWHGAQRWVQRPLADAALLRETMTRVGGHATLWRTHDGSRSDDAFTRPAESLLRIHRGLKHEFDPGGILGPGRMYADL